VSCSPPSGFSRDIISSRTEIQQRRVRLGRKPNIVSLCQYYLQAAEGIWQLTADLAEIMLAWTL
jgi:hypothetical protein